jgi:anti-sigma factor RsiW
MKHTTRNESEHASIWELLPWYLNDTLTELDRKRVDLHLTACAACRDEMAIERRIHERVARNDTVEHIATPSLRRLQERIDDLATAATPVAERRTPAATAFGKSTRAPSRVLMAGTDGGFRRDTGRGTHPDGDPPSAAYSGEDAAARLLHGDDSSPAAAWGSDSSRIRTHHHLG